MTLQADINTYIDSCLDVNGSWRETFNELAILYTLDLDLDLEGSIISDCIIEEMTEKGHEIGSREIDNLVSQFLSDFNYRIPAEWFQDEYNMEMAKEVAFNSGADEDCVKDYLLEIA